MTVEPICINCIYFRPGRPGPLTCDAFPHGIPTKILQGVIDHRKEHHPNDKGLLFKSYTEGASER